MSEHYVDCRRTFFSTEIIHFAQLSHTNHVHQDENQKKIRPIFRQKRKNR